VTSPADAVRGDRLWRDLMAMAEVGATPDGGSQRLALTDEDRAGRELFAGWACAAGLQLRADRAGNLFARRPGRDPARPAVMTGSHLDTQPNGGRFDGVFGVLAGLEAVRALDDAGVETQAPIDVVVWANEEGGRFPQFCTGSAVYAGAATLDHVRALRAFDGPTYGEELDRVGFAGDEEPGAAPASAYLELHIEQGPVLESMNRPAGVVLGTFGVERHLLRFTGQAAHSGSTPIPMRRDAFLAAAETALACREIARRHSRPGAGVVCTVGVVDVEPKIVTAVPGACEISLDQRALDPAVLAAMHREAREASQRSAGSNHVLVDWKHLWRIDPRPFDPALVTLCEDAVREQTGDAPRLPSGPLHDAAEMVPHMAAVMMFAYSSKGLSHCKEEDTPEPHLETTISAYLRLVDKTIAYVSRNS
jgi:hydantoinase/carbamoylase family amidase